MFKSMKKLLFPIICIFLVCISCDNNPQTPSKNNNDSSEFIGKWIADDINIMGVREDAENYYWEYQEIAEELKVYYAQINFTKIDQLNNQLDRLNEQYHDDYIGSCDVLDIGNGIIKIGRADLYLNPTSTSNCWFWNDAFTQFRKNMKIGLVVEDWETYRFTMRDGALYFNNDQECLFFAGSKLVWEGVTDFMPERDLIPLIVK